MTSRRGIARVGTNHPTTIDQYRLKAFSDNDLTWRIGNETDLNGLLYQGRIGRCSILATKRSNGLPTLLITLDRQKSRFPLESNLCVLISMMALTKEIEQDEIPRSRLAIVTGASRGIGAAIARNLAAKGLSIVLNYMSDGSRRQAECLAAKLESKFCVKCFAIQMDISQPGAAESLIKAVQEQFAIPKRPFQIDILVNNAGVARNAEIGNITVDDFEWMYRVNVLGPLLMLQAVLPWLPHDRSGRVINLSSISSTEGFHGQTIYGGTKAALEAMTRTWARELAARCTVNAINPGPALTDMWENMPLSHKKGLESWISHTPMAAVRKGIDSDDIISEAAETGGRPAYCHEIAGIVGMLCMEDSVWCTGQVVCANGGMRMAI